MRKVCVQCWRRQLGGVHAKLTQSCICTSKCATHGYRAVSVLHTTVVARLQVGAAWVKLEGALQVGLRVKEVAELSARRASPEERLHVCLLLLQHLRHVPHACERQCCGPKSTMVTGVYV